MISFPRRERAQTAAAVVGVDAGKFSHTLVIRPRGQPDSKPFSFPTTRQGFEAAVAFLRQQAPGAALGWPRPMPISATSWRRGSGCPSSGGGR